MKKHMFPPGMTGFAQNDPTAMLEPTSIAAAGAPTCPDDGGGGQAPTWSYDSNLGAAA